MYTYQSIVGGSVLSGSAKFKIKGLIYTIFEDLDIPNLNLEECTDSLYYVNALLDKEENPESFIKHQMIKIMLEYRLTEIKIRKTDLSK